MDLTKVKLNVGEGCTYSSVPLYLIIKGGSKLLVTAPVLAKRRKDLHRQVREADPPVDTGVVLVRGAVHPLVKGGVYITTVKKREKRVRVSPNATRIYRVHPNRLTEKQRLRMVGPGEQGEMRRQFVEDGLTGNEQRHRAREHTAMEEAEWRKSSRSKKRERRKANRKRDDYQQPDPEPEAQVDAPYSVKEVAKLAGQEPGDIRKFLRRKRIGKRGGHYAFTAAETKKIARAVKKYYKEES